jgi:hypothetical protein
LKTLALLQLLLKSHSLRLFVDRRGVGPYTRGREENSATGYSPNCETQSRSEPARFGRYMAKRRRLPIGKLLNYWEDISKSPTLTVGDYDVFLDRVDATMEHFDEMLNQHYLRSNKFFAGMQTIRLIKFHRKKPGELSRAEYSTMKDVAKKFIPRIRKYFAQDLVVAINTKSPQQDAEAILSSSTKLTHLWAAGIIISNHLATMLIKLSSFKCKDDDIMQLYTNLKNRATNQKLKNFLTKSFRRFEDARKLRSRCAHVLEGEPTKQEIDQAIQLARLLQKHMARP